MSRTSLTIAVLMASSIAHAQDRPTLFGQPIHRDGVHFQVGFGAGASTAGGGLFHIMELGGTFGGGITVGVLHTFFQNRGFAQNAGAPDLFGAWMIEIAIPLIVPEIVFKWAVGLGVEHDQSNGIRPIGGFGWAIGFDFYYPLDPRHGPTLGILALNTLVEGRNSLGVSLFLGWTVF